MKSEQVPRTKIKICGIKSVETAAALGSMNPDFVGFVFAKSKRQVSPKQAGEMIAALRQAGSRAAAAGVFVNPSLAELEHVLREAPLDMIQLHGQETPEYCVAVRSRFSGVSIYKVISMTNDDESSMAAKRQIIAFRGSADAVMLDTEGGGTGRAFNWALIPELAAAAKDAGLPLFIAGGLHPDNVADCVSTYRPDGVDVSSGVETDGQKDLNKIVTFIERVKSVDQQRT